MSEDDGTVEGGELATNPGAIDEALSRAHQRDRIDAATAEELLELVGHEIRTPLALIRGAIELLNHDADELSSLHRQLVGRIDRNAHLGLLLLDRFADIRAVDRGTLELNRSELDLEQLIRDTAHELHEAVLGGRPLNLTTESDRELVTSVDERRIEQIVFNLLTNAALNTPAGADLNITFREVDGHVEVEFRNHGHGVAPDDADEMFEKFPVLDASRQGAGMGLYLSRGIARAHGGDLWAEPSEEDEGIFVLRLPLTGEGADDD